jgi:hypothetical protein
VNFGSKKTYAYSENDFIFVRSGRPLAVCINNAACLGRYLEQERIEETFKAVPDERF